MVRMWSSWSGMMPRRQKEDVSEVQQKMSEYQGKYGTCLEHYLDLFHLCQGMFMENIQEPINHTKLLRELGYKFKHFL
jgi:hypothetical protein